MLISFIGFLAVFVAVGLIAARRGVGTTEDYLTAGRNVNPYVAGVSFFATENSGIMFIGFIGMAYVLGLSSLWIVIGWYLGEIVILSLLGRKLRHATEETKAPTFSTLLANWNGQNFKYVRILSALFIVVFMAFYAAAQLSASGKALNVLIGWDLSIAAAIGFLIVMAYCFMGGLRASLWTDVLQAFAMLASLILLVGICLAEIGGIGALFAQLHAIDPALTDMLTGSYKYGLIGFVLGWFFAGVGVMGQAHLVIRFMVIEKADSAHKTVGTYAVMVIAMAILSTAAALCARVLLPELGASDPELALPLLSAEYMPGILSGIFLAGLFAATISTADSQILSSSAALTHDLTPQYKDKLIWSRIGTLLVGLLALAIVLSGDKNVFQLATYGWSLMAASMAPLVILYCLGKKPTQAHAIIMMIGGTLASYLWHQYGLTAHIYNVLPGIVTGLALYFGLKPFFKNKA